MEADLAHEKPILIEFGITSAGGGVHLVGALPGEADAGWAIAAVEAALDRAEDERTMPLGIEADGGELDQVETYRGTTVKMGLADKMRFEIAVSDAFVEPAIQALCEGGRTGEVGDGKIFVVPLERVVRIRTGETDNKAVTPVGA